MDNERNRIQVSNATANQGLQISTQSINQTISATNNKALYYAEQAKKYKDEAKEMRDLAKYYAEQNSDVTVGYINGIKTALETEIDTKQDAGDYALNSDLPTKVSDLTNDSDFVTRTQLNTDLNLKQNNLPNLLTGKFLTNDGTNLSWAGVRINNIFDIKWSDHLLDDVSWLRADTFSWQDGTTYSTAYNELLSEYNNASSTTVTEGNVTFKLTPKGYKIASASEESDIISKYNSTGIAWYYILDTTNRRFKLPRMKYKYWKNFTNTTLPVKGNGKGLGLTDGTKNYVLDRFGNTSAFATSGSEYSSPLAVGTSLMAGTPGNKDTVWGVTTDSTKSGIVADCSSIKNNIEETGFYLYFYVGEYSQSAVEQTAGLNAELFNGKVDVATYNSNPRTTAVYLKTSYVNGTSGYNIWSNGYCEQWGYINIPSTDINVTLTKTYRDTNYNVQATNRECDSIINVRGLSVNQFNVDRPSSNTGYMFWKASGYLASGQY